MVRAIIGLAVCGMFCVLGLVSCGGLLLWAQRAGANSQEEFFTAMQSGDPQQVFALCDPALVEQIDAPVLATLMEAVQTNLGAFKGAGFNFQANAHVGNGVSQSSSEVEVQMEHGTAKSKLGYRNNKLIEFNINSDKLPANWIKGLKDTTLYRDRGQVFYENFFGGQPDAAFGLMHVELQKAVPQEKLNEMAAKVLAQNGALKSIAIKRDSLDVEDNHTNLNIVYTMEFENLTTTATATFQFAGMKGHLLAFKLHPTPIE